MNGELGGCFALFRADAIGAEAATAFARVNPVYYAETAECHVVGSRALLVHLVARASATGLLRPPPALDVAAMQPMVRHGFYTNDETPFDGVRALPAAATLTIRPAGARITQQEFPEPEPAPRSTSAARARIAGLAEALLAAARPIARHGQPVELALSGGRDSRLMAAVLTAAGVPITARTHGFPDDPDVILAQRIARALGIDHHVDHHRELTVSQQRPDAIVVEHPLARAHHVIGMCEGMTSAYERIDNPTPYALVPRTSGSGGETLRGGFLYDQHDQSQPALERRVKTIFRSADAFLTPDAQARAANDHAPWAERARRDAPDVLDKLYLLYRSGRWIVGSHTATLLNGPYYHPFFDNRVVRHALMLPATWRSSEEVVFRLLEHLAPPLVNIPPEGQRWRFEQERARSLRDWWGWRQREALRPHGRTAGFNWRKHYDDGFLSLLRDQVMTGPRELFDIVDEVQCKKLFAQPPTGWHNQIWHIFTLSVLLTGSWRTERPDLPDVTIPIPHG
ncbi:asparagine synthase-related protein [Actinomadura rupiterrae]|uniref:asparagine synthase-related protein n=1 Tax=Actinomadura rupiterrae TaxID=559627 RepID=UPI0020A3F1E0|nr:asparagine synthase-related protein [Actinomadura rupiterrae]MCP2341550.1 hypothetical protein [Actinomadura rupiterrae]